LAELALATGRLIGAAAAIGLLGGGSGACAIGLLSTRPAAAGASAGRAANGLEKSLKRETSELQPTLPAAISANAAPRSHTRPRYFSPSQDMLIYPHATNTTGELTRAE
jgi:hypothetical protein